MSACKHSLMRAAAQVPVSELIMPLPPSAPRSRRGSGSGGMRAMQYKQASEASRPSTARVPAPAPAAHHKARAVDTADRNKENKENWDGQRISVKVLGHKDISRKFQAASGDDMLMRVQSLPLNAHAAAEGDGSVQDCSVRPAAGRPASGGVNRC